MVLSLICLVIIVGSVLLGSTTGARRERRLPPHLAFLSEDEPVEQDGRFRRLLAWLRSLVTEPEGGYGGWSSGGGFGGFGASAVAEAVEAVGVAAAEGASYAWLALVRTRSMEDRWASTECGGRSRPWVA